MVFILFSPYLPVLIETLIYFRFIETVISIKLIKIFRYFYIEFLRFKK